MAKLAYLALLTAASTALAGSSHQADPAIPPAPTFHVEVLPDSGLRDVAIAVYHPERPRIYFNPRLMNRLSPELQAFFLAHEYAHIDLRHTRASALRATAESRNEALQQKELEADCLATRRLAADHAKAAEAAIRFFRRQGNSSYDAEHPNGTRRADNIASCLTTE
jgi:hypothetical protein